MKIILENKEDLEEIIQYEELDNKEIIIQKELSHYLISEYEELKRENNCLNSHLYFKSNNIIKDLIEEENNINKEIAEFEGYKPKNYSEIKKGTIKDIKTELENLKVKENISAEDIAKTNLFFQLYQQYGFMHPTNINKVISKLEKDLAELES